MPKPCATRSLPRNRRFWPTRSGLRKLTPSAATPCRPTARAARRNHGGPCGSHLPSRFVRRQSHDVRKPGNVARKSVNVVRKPGNVVRKLGNVVRKLGNVARKSVNVVRKLGNVARKSVNVARKLGNVARKLGNVVRKSGNVVLKSENPVKMKNLGQDDKKSYSGCLNPEPGAEPPAAVVRFRTVVIKEDPAEASITKERTADFSHVRRRFYPARRLRIEISQLLQLQILFFRQKLNAHGRGHINGGVFRFKFFPRIQPFPVVTNTGAAFGTFG